MYPAILPSSDNTHRANPGMCDEYTEIDEDGIEYIVPDHLICRALTITLKDDTLRWVAADETSRLETILNNARSKVFRDFEAGEREEMMSDKDVLAVMAREGYTKIGVAYSSPDEGFEEHHFLMKSVSGMHIVVAPILVDEGFGFYVDSIGTSVTDLESDCLILRLASKEDILLARQSGLLCEDDQGAHVQVKPWRSIQWQCSGKDGQCDQERLREVWRHYVKNTIKNLS